MRLTRRGHIVMWAALVTVGMLIGFFTAPYSISYENGVDIINTYKEDK